jgi:hypothetical protein
MKKLGDKFRIDLGQYVTALKDKGAFLVCQHMGPGWFRKKSMTFAKLQQLELIRLVALRKQFTEAEFPELYGKDANGNASYATAEHSEAVEAHALAMLAECATGVEIPPELGLPQSARELVDYLGIAPFLLGEMLAGQRLEPEQVF